mgnify:CR=1 FL=1
MLAIEAGGHTIRHLGTQYMVAAIDQETVVTVREGRVQIAGPAGRHEGAAKGSTGTRLTFSGDDVSRTSVARSAPDWAWLSAVPADFDTDERAARETLAWFVRETERAAGLLLAVTAVTHVETIVATGQCVPNLAARGATQILIGHQDESAVVAAFVI